jgi:hypothetical protein
MVIAWKVFATWKARLKAFTRKIAASKNFAWKMCPWKIHPWNIHIQ